MRSNSVEQYQLHYRFIAKFWTVAALVLAAFLGLALAYSTIIGAALLVAVPVIFILIFTWQKPKIAVFVFFAISMTVETFASGFADETTEKIRFFIPITDILSGSGIIFNSAEIFMAVVVGICLLRGISLRSMSLRGGLFLVPLLLYYGWVIWGIINGMLTGGTLKLSFWEIRGQAYFLIFYLLSVNLLTKAKDLDVLGWLIILGSGMKGVQGFIRYFFTINRDLTGLNSLLEHDEAFFFNLYFFHTFLLFITNGSKAQKRVALLLLPFVFIANVANQRRAATGGLVIAVLMLIPILYVVFKQQRAMILRIVAIGGVLVSFYGAVFWNSNSTIAQPIRAIRSQITPDERDASSDQYRINEDKDLFYTIQLSPLRGFGYGKELIEFYPIIQGGFDVRVLDPFILLMPHNAILWVWMRLGSVGFLIFWFMISQFIIRACHMARTYTTPLIQRWALLAIVAVVLNLTQGYWDMGLYSYRIQIYLGILVGALANLPSIQQELCLRQTTTHRTELHQG